MTKVKPSTKPAKPYPGFPLTTHPNGQWCKKIRGRVHSFGVWADPMAALGSYNRQAADLHAGHQPRKWDSGDTPAVKDLADSYLAVQEEKAQRGLIRARWFDDCLRAVKDFVVFAGTSRPWDDLGPGDFGKYRMDLYGEADCRLRFRVKPRS